MNKKQNILQDILGELYKSRDELLFYCPFCKHHKKKLSINLDKSVFKCWICDTKGNTSYLVRRFGTSDNKHQWALLNQEIDMSAIDILFDKQEEELEQSLPLPKEYVCLSQKRLPHAAKRALSYLYTRGLTSRDILYYKIGFCETGKYKKRIIMPSFNESGDCNFFVARTFINSWLKYKNPPVSKNIIFNDLLIDWTRPITLVEGIFDAIKIDNSIPLLGSTLSENSKLFKKLAFLQSKIYIGLDNDALSKSLNIITAMMQYGLEVNLLNTENIEDIGSITKTEATQLKKSSKMMSTENIFDICWRTND